MAPLESLLTTEDVAKYLKVDVVTVRRLVSRGELATYRVGAEYRFTLVDLQDYLMRRYVPVTPQPRPDDRGGKLFGPYWSLREIFAPLGHSRSGNKPVMGARFTETAAHALALSQAAADHQRCGHIYSSHLLLGLAEAAPGVANTALGELAITPEWIKSVLADHPKLTGPTRETGDQLNLGPDVKRALEAAVAEARKLSHDYLGTEHLLLGLLADGRNKASAVLRVLEVKPGAVRVRILDLLRNAGHKGPGRRISS